MNEEEVDEGTGDSGGPLDETPAPEGEGTPAADGAPAQDAEPAAPAAEEAPAGGLPAAEPAAEQEPAPAAEPVEWDGTAEGLEKVTGWEQVPEPLRKVVADAVAKAESDRAEITRLLTGGHDDIQKAVDQAVETIKAELVEKHRKELDDLRTGKVSAEDSYKSEIANRDREIAQVKSALAEKDAEIAAYQEEFSTWYQGAIEGFIKDSAPGVLAAVAEGKPDAFDFFVEVLSNGEALKLPKHLPDAMKVAMDMTRARFPDVARAPRQPEPLPKAEELMHHGNEEVVEGQAGLTMFDKLRAAKRSA